MPNNDALIDAVNLYFDALYECDTVKLNAVFHKDSSLFDADNGTIFVEPIDSFSRDVGGRVSPASKGQERDQEILMIDYLKTCLWITLDSCLAKTDGRSCRRSGIWKRWSRPNPICRMYCPSPCAAAPSAILAAVPAK